MTHRYKKLPVSAGVLKVRPDTKAPKKFSDIYILHFSDNENEDAV